MYLDRTFAQRIGLEKVESKSEVTQSTLCQLTITVVVIAIVISLILWQMAINTTRNLS